MPPRAPIDPAVVKRITEEAIDRVLGLGWRRPWLMLVGASLRFRVTDRACGAPNLTAAIDWDGWVYINPEFWGLMNKDQQFAILAHEALHLLLGHEARRRGRDHRMWNHAADQAINSLLRKAGLTLPEGFKYPPDNKIPFKCVFPPEGKEDLSAEELYEELKNKTEDELGSGMAGAGCGVIKPQGKDGDKDDDKDGDGHACSGQPGDGSNGTSEAEAAQRWAEIAAQTRALAKMSGDGMGDAIADLLSPPPAKVPWASVLRTATARAVAAHGYDDVAVGKRNRRTGPNGPQFPGPVSHRCQVAVVIDASGSMWDQATLNRLVAETIGILRAAGTATYLVVHDDGVQWQGWLRADARVPQIQAKIKGGGGTTFEAAYEAIEGSHGRFSAMVHLTDGYVGRWPNKPSNVKKYVVALVGTSASQIATPDGAQVIETEL